MRDVRASLKKAMQEGRLLEVDVTLGGGVITPLLVNCANVQAAAVVQLPEDVALDYGLQRTLEEPQQ